MDKIIIAENKRGLIFQFTQQQWDNMVNSGHARTWKILEEEIAPVIDQPIKVQEVEHIENIDFKTYLDVEVQLDYSYLLDQAGVKYNKRIKDPKKLKAIWEKSQENREPFNDEIPKI
jgi:hypothetical protein